MTVILLASDSDKLFTEIDACLAGQETEVVRVSEGADVVPAVEQLDPDLVLLDLQIGNMGGVACCSALRQEEGAGRIAKRPIALLLDREADVFLAQSVKADGWLVKPIDSLVLRRMTRELRVAGLEPGAGPETQAV